MTTLHLKRSTSRSPSRLALLLIPLVFACFALLPPKAFGVLPAPDGGYANDNTAEGTNALFSLTTGANNTAIGSKALFGNTTGRQNTATGDHALRHNTTGEQNTATGSRALFDNETGIQNTATGAYALFFNTIGERNTANGYFALVSNTTGSDNTANGERALFRNTTGHDNIALGAGAGENLTTGSNNIDLDDPGVGGESNTIRIGTQGIQTTAFIAGISGVAVTGTAVAVNGSGQLGVAPSSQRFKDEIKPMDKASQAILSLKPVTFRYKKEIDPERAAQFGLVAEDVAKVNPDLVVRDADGKVYTVRYEAVNAMLLNEFLKEHKTVQDQGATIAELKKEIEALTVGLQKVSAQLAAASPSGGGLEASKPAPQVVKNP